MKSKRLGLCLPLLAFLFCLCAANAWSQTTGFTYQGRLTDGGTPANGTYDFRFQLYDSATGDNLIGSELHFPATTVTNGVFSLTLDFGPNAFPGTDRFLQIIVQQTGGPPPPILLSPRQQITSTPYAIRSISAVSADTASNATQLGGTAASQFVLTGDARLSDARPPAAGSSNYIQNGTTLQASSDFNINGTGKANTFDANQFSVGGARVLSNAGTSNLFAGEGAGETNNSGKRNSFFGYHAGNANTIGDLNSFFGNSAGPANKDGRSNDFFGDSAGLFNGNGSFNSFFGSQSGSQNTSGSSNTFVGNYAGQTNTTGSGNTIIGFQGNVLSTNLNNATAIGANARVDQDNALVLGSINGVNQATADTNVGIGTTTPVKRLHVVGDGLFEGNLNVTGTISGNFGGTIQTANNALNLGGVAAGQYVQTSDARLFDARPPSAGSGNYIQNGTTAQASSNFNVSGIGQADTFDAATQFKLGGTRVLSNAGANNFFAGQGAGQANDAGSSNSFFGNSAGLTNTSGSFNAFFGSGSGRANVDGNNNAFFGFTSGRSNTSGANNSFFGNAAGSSNVDSSNNALFGFNSGRNVTGQNGGLNSFFGANTGVGTTSGFQNSFFGSNAGSQNTGGSNNTIIGYNSDLGSGNLFNATAIGAQAQVTQSNSLVLGSINNVNGATADTNVGIGTTAPSAKLHVVGDGLFTGNLTVNGSLNATVATATNALQLGGVAANQYVQTSDSRLSDARSPAPGSSNYIQNGTTPQAASNFNISGNGTIGNTLKIGSFPSLTFTNSGVGIGTIPTFPVDVNVANGNTTAKFGPSFPLYAVHSFPSLGFNTYFINGGWKFGKGSTNHFGAVIDENPTDGVMSFSTSDSGAEDAAATLTERMRLTQSGNLGIGTTAPNTRLHVFSAQNPGFQVETNDTSFAETQYKAGNYIWRTGVGGASVVNGAANKYYIYDINAGEFRMAIDTAGNFGIGTTSPTSKLHVMGDGLFTGNLTVNGNINGNLSLNTINATTQYNLGGSQIIGGNGDPGAGNFFAGFRSGQSTTGGYNAFFGVEAGKVNGSGTRNSFFGYQAGLNNTNGHDNSYFGYNSGLNCTGSGNSFFGQGAGMGANSPPNNLCTGSNNSFFGQTGGSLSSGNQNSAYGQNAGSGISSGSNNSFLGFGAGASTSTGSDNVFIGQSSGGFNPSGSENTAIGSNAWITSPDQGNPITNATAIGSRALVTKSNSLVLGGITSAGSPFGVDTNVGIGTTAPDFKLHVIDPGINGVNTATGGLRVQTNTAGRTLASFGDKGVFQIDDANNAGGRLTVLESGYVGVGTNAPTSKLHVVGDGLFTGDLTVNGNLNANLSLNTVNASTQYNLGGSRVLSVSGTQNTNTFAGVQAGDANPTGGFNSFFGNGAGLTTGTGFNNSFFGSGSGNANTNGQDNSFFGRNAGFANTASQNSFFGSFAGAANSTGNKNSFFGFQAGSTNSHGINNSFFGHNAGFANTTISAGQSELSGDDNSFFGSASGQANTYGGANSFFGSSSGTSNTNGRFNSFFGFWAGKQNTTGLYNSFFGYQSGQANTASENSFFGGLAGTSNTSGVNNTFFGFQTGTTNTDGQDNSFFGHNAGMSNTTAFLGQNEINGSFNSFFGSSSGQANTTGRLNTFIGAQSGQNTVNGSGNTFLGQQAGGTNTNGGYNTLVGVFTDLAANNLDHATALGAEATVSTSNTIALGRSTGQDTVQVPGNLNVTGTARGRFTILQNGNFGIGTTAPEQQLHVNGEVLSTGPSGGFKFRDPDSGADWIWHASLTNSATIARLSFNGQDFILVDPLGTTSVKTLRLQQVNNTLGGGQQSICRDNLNFIGDCSSSLRYKTNIAPFNTGLNFIKQLRPISFDWKAGGMHDVGFGAEDVAKINPLFVTYNKDGQVEGVKYDRLSTVFVNAFKEQQTQIEQQQEQIKKQQTEIDALKKLVCADHPNADVCTPRK